MTYYTNSTELEVLKALRLRTWQQAKDVTDTIYRQRRAAADDNLTLFRSILEIFSFWQKGAPEEEQRRNCTCAEVSLILHQQVTEDLVERKFSCANPGDLSPTFATYRLTNAGLQRLFELQQCEAA